MWHLDMQCPRLAVIAELDQTLSTPVCPPHPIRLARLAHTVSSSEGSTGLVTWIW